jgi:NAD(P)-dependent dehydrogenase (short-subunit alcohol dehydrogenase family)
MTEPGAVSAARALSLAGKTAIVTGAAQGLGRAEALALARRGARVLLVDRLDCGEVAQEIAAAGGEAAKLTVDLADPEAADAVLAAAVGAFGDVDVLVNNAGLVRDRMSFNLSDRDWEEVLAVNLSASFRLCRAAVGHWRDRSREGAPGERSIVNTTSESGLYGNAGQANYAAAKAGVAAITLTLAAELDRYGIRVNAIAPRARTPMSADAFGDLPQARSFDPFGPEHVAEVVAWLASGAAADVSGQVLVVHGGGVAAMRTWSPEREVRRGSGWTDAELVELRARLFPAGDAKHLAAPVGDLFGEIESAKEASLDLGPA